MKALLLGFILSGMCIAVFPGELTGKITLSGYIRDSKGEALIGATIFINDLQIGAVSNAYGYYSISFPGGKHMIAWSFVGYKTFTLQKVFFQDSTINISLSVLPKELKGVQINAKKESLQLNRLNMSTFQLNSEDIKRIPSLGGEPDLLKTIQLLPGIQAPGEGIASFVVRGGNYDQNLIILDEAIVYNPSHLLGFFSIFNTDVLKETVIYKGDIPAKYGGRLSSLLEVNLKDGNKTRFAGAGSIGNILSKLTLEGPILNKKGSVLVSGRRSYADLFLPLSKDPDVRSNRLFFYDTYLKANYQFNHKNRFFLSSFLGRDLFKYKNEYYLTSGNISGSARWNHLFGPRLFSNLSMVYSQYDFRLGQQADITGVEWDAAMSDTRLKYDFTWYLNTQNTVKFGFSSAFLKFRPGKIISGTANSLFNNFEIPPSQVLDHALYLSNDQKVGNKLKISYGIRATLFQNMGPATVYNFDDNYEQSDSTVYRGRKIYHSFAGIEPRFSLTWILSEYSAVRTSFNRSLQQVHLISNSNAGTPLDIWVPSGPNIKPQFANQYAIGYQRNFFNNRVEMSVESFYKKMMNQIDFKDHAQLILNPVLEGELRTGYADAYGFEFLVKKSVGKWQGMIGYTLSKATRYFPDLNQGKPFPAGYDRRHDLSVLVNWEPARRWAFSLTSIYITGAPYTLPVGRFEYGNVVIPLYSERNAYRMPDYFRLDLSATLKSKIKPGRRFNGKWQFAIYNVTNRKNAWLIYFQSDKENLLETHAYKLYLFPVIPSISYSFNF